MGNSSSSKAVATASNESNSTFDEVMCQRFNAFYDMDPLPAGRVRPKFEGSEPPLALVAHSNYESIKQFRGINRSIITPDVQDEFIKLFAQFEPFPTPLAGCLIDATTLKQLKKNDSDKFANVQSYDDAKDTKADFKLKFNLILCKLKFLGFIVEYVTKPVVLEWDKYMKQKQGQQTLSPEVEKQLSTLLQIKLLEGMVDMIEKTKSNVAVNAYVPTGEEIKNYETLKNKLIALQRKREQQQPQQQQQQQPQMNLNQEQREETEEALYPLGGGSKYKRQSKRRKQRNQQKRRQKSKKYCKYII
jgi:hypothetical protein